MIRNVKVFQIVHRNAIINADKNIFQTKLYEHLHILQNFIFFLFTPHFGPPKLYKKARTSVNQAICNIAWFQMGKITTSPKKKYIMHFKSFCDKCLFEKRVFQTVKIWNKITFLEIQNII